jgi:hypothetical protein
MEANMLDDDRPRLVRAAPRPRSAAKPSGRRRPWLALGVLGALVASAVCAAAPAMATTPTNTVVKKSKPKKAVAKKVAKKAKKTAPDPAAVNQSGLDTAGVENWAAPSLRYHAVTPVTKMPVLPDAGAIDGMALKLQLDAYPESGPHGGAVIASNSLYRYGNFGTRMKTADCTGQDHPGVITGTFAYSYDHADANHNGVTDNDEIDIEFLCGQPDVVYLSIWTDYSETSNDLREITRAINLRTGEVLSNCYIVADGSGCQPPLEGENSPASVPAIAGFNSATQFHTYSFNWQPDDVTFYATDDAGQRIVLWDYRGPASRIPGNPAFFMQNVQYTRTWNPLNGPSHNQPTADTSAYIDSTFVPSS